MYKNILIPVDFGHDGGVEKALAIARVLAGTSAKFTVMHVMETLPGYVTGQLDHQVLDQRKHELQEALDKIAATLDGATAQLVSGHAGQTIVHFADNNDIDCIVVSSHKPALADMFIGSTANRVVHYANCAVHVIR